MMSTGRDNLSPFPKRPNGVDRLEDALRDSFAYAVGSGLSPGRDLAEVAICRGRRRVRRQALGSTAALTAVALLVSGGVALLGPPAGQSMLTGPVEVVHPTTAATADEVNADTLMAPGPTPMTEQMSVADLPVDVIADHVLLAREGVRIELSPVGTPTTGYRLAGGYLIVSAAPAGGNSLWFASAAASPRRLLGGDLRAVVVDAGSARVSWREADQVGVARVEAGQLVGAQRSKIISDAQPVGFLGPAVRLARVAGDGHHVGQDSWLPDRAGYTPSWDHDALAVYGGLPDGRTLVGQVAGSKAERCLALLDAATLQATRMACGLALTPQARGWLSPGGRWLIAEVKGAAGPEAALVDLLSVFTGQMRTVTLGAAPYGGVVWEDDHTLVRALRSTLQRLRLDRLWAGQSGGTEEFPVPGAPPGARVLVVAES